MSQTSAPTHLHPRHRIRAALRIARLGVTVAEAGYAAAIAVNWLRYGRPAAATGDAVDPLLDELMPNYDVVERHSTRVGAPAEITLAAAGETDLGSSAVVRLIFKARALVLGARADEVAPQHGLLAQVKALGWTVLAERDGREIVLGAVTQPWKADVVFRGLPADEFVSFNEPGYIKIVWNLRADPVDAESSVFRTETRAVATDARARRKFRWYWARFSPGIALIRRMMVRTLKHRAEQRAAG